MRISSATRMDEMKQGAPLTAPLSACRLVCRSMPRSADQPDKQVGRAATGGLVK
jgi:hypothetical protein